MSIFSGFSAIDEDFYEELEETLIMGDLGVRATMDIIEDLKEKVKEQHIKEPLECRQLLIDSIREQMDVGETAYEFENRTSVVFVIGVNGVGKTTTIGKLAGKLKEQGRKIALATASTEELYKPVLKRNGILDQFDCFVSTEQVKRGKGFPDVYELAAEKLGLEVKAGI